MSTGRKPEGLTGLGKRVSGAAAWAGGTHVADSRVSPYDQTGLGQRVLEDTSGVLVSSRERCGGWGEEKLERRNGERGDGGPRESRACRIISRVAKT